MNYIIFNFDVEFNDEQFIKKMRSFDLEQSYKNLNNEMNFKKITFNYLQTFYNYKLIETACINNYIYIMINLIKVKWSGTKYTYEKLLMITIDHKNIIIAKLLIEKIMYSNYKDLLMNMTIANKIVSLNNYTLIKLTIELYRKNTCYYVNLITTICEKCDLAIILYTLENYYNYKKPSQYIIIKSMCAGNSFDVAEWCLNNIQFESTSYYNRLFKILFKNKKFDIIKLLYKKIIANNHSIEVTKNYLEYMAYISQSQ